MHETALISSVISILSKQAAKHAAGRVSRVHLRLGKGPHNLEPERVEEVFALLARGTIAEGAELEITPAPPDQEEELVIEKFEVVQKPPAAESGGQAA
jgi:Zn finger protein HypA/HybF involved in hydrogenase expression